MKRLLSALTAGTLALSLLGATAASAQPYRHGGWGHGGGWNNRGWERNQGSPAEASDFRRRTPG